MKRTKIVATVGPVSKNYEMLKKMGEAGVNIFRLNFSHGNHEDHGKVIQNIKKLNKETGKNYAIMLDMKGPAIRTGDVKKPITVKTGEKVIFTIEKKPYEETKKFQVDYNNFIHDVRKGETILIDNGLMAAKIQNIKGKDVICKMIEGGVIGSRRHINLPGQHISMPSVTKKDWDDLEFGLSLGIDFAAISFVRNAKEIYEIKAFLKKKKANVSVIAKIETTEGVKNIDSIFEAVDGIMVARGDLGVEVPFEHVPLIQWDIAQKAAIYKKPVIVATNVVESMIQNPMPTRAEVSDIFASTWQRNDAIMLSGETAAGLYPIKSIEAIYRTARETERNYLSKNRPPRRVEITDDKSEFCKNAADAVRDLPNMACIMVITKSGFMANLMSSFRPAVPIFAFTEDEAVQRKLQLLWGTYSFKIKLEKNPEHTIDHAIKKIRKEFPHLKRKNFVLISDLLIEKKMTPVLQFRTI